MVGPKTVGTFVGAAAAGGRPTLDQEKGIVIIVLFSLHKTGPAAI